ncbi:MAG: FkbM family methyltransferase [Clostridia bacterium]|nr:FkbM family methyltransferase [Clostridia bacterium]
MELWKRLQQSNKPIVLYGMGNGADRILDVMSSKGITASGVFASDGFVRHQMFRGFTVQSYGELKEQFGEMIVLVSFGTHRPEVIENIKRIMAEQEGYAPDVPVAGETLFDASFLDQHRAELARVYELLADERSKQVFERVIESKLTGLLPPLFASESWPREAWDLLELGQEESYLDLGAYNGDTVERFWEYSKGKYRQVIAVEPDVKNYKKLLKNTEHLPHIQCVNACVDEAVGEKHYLMDGGRKSHALDSGGIEIPAVTVDLLAENQKITFIKMDVEGMEAAVIKGAAQTIQRDRPAMQIAAYHRSEDLFALPLLVEEICPGAKIYLRHFKSVPAWDTDFYIKY